MKVSSNNTNGGSCPTMREYSSAQELVNNIPYIAMTPSEKTLETIRKQADEEGINSIAMPLIGAGYGGLSWKKVRPIIEWACCPNKLNYQIIFF